LFDSDEIEKASSGSSFTKIDVTFHSGFTVEYLFFLAWQRCSTIDMSTPASGLAGSAAT
jgi:hypothetical protein